MTDYQISEALIGIMSQFGMEVNVDSVMYQATSVAVVFVLAWLFHLFTRTLLHNKITRLILSSKNSWDDELHSHGFFKRCAHASPALVIYLTLPLLLPPESLSLVALQKLSMIYLCMAGVLAGYALLNTLHDVYNASHFAKRTPITGFIQVGKLLLTVIAILVIISGLLDKSPMLLLSGLGALTAITLLVFRDTILGFVAGIQIAANRMVNNGDWIEMPEFKADGTVMAIGLTTVKVRNWDNTISTIPTYALIDKTMKNWRGMEESGGRRIKRAISIDIQSVRFCDHQLLERFARVRYIQKYIESKKQELADFNNTNQITEADLINSRRLSNIGTYRAYLEHYLRNHPGVNQDMTLMVRQLAPSELGLPLEIYCFSKDKAWVNYEKLQADIFDHAIAMLPVFELRAYQRVSDNPHNHRS